jgi:hypothetical protein
MSFSQIIISVDVSLHVMSLYVSVLIDCNCGYAANFYISIKGRSPIKLLYFSFNYGYRLQFKTHSVPAGRQYYKLSSPEYLPIQAIQQKKQKRDDGESHYCDEGNGC